MSEVMTGSIAISRTAMQRNCYLPRNEVCIFRTFSQYINCQCKPNFYSNVATSIYDPITAALKKGNKKKKTRNRWKVRKKRKIHRQTMETHICVFNDCEWNTVAISSNKYFAQNPIGYEAAPSGYILIYPKTITRWESVSKNCLQRCKE